MRGDNIKIDKKKKRTTWLLLETLIPAPGQRQKPFTKGLGSAELLFLFLMNSEIWNMEILFRLLPSRIRVTAVRPLAVCRGQRGAIGLGYLNNIAQLKRDRKRCAFSPHKMCHLSLFLFGDDCDFKRRDSKDVVGSTLLAVQVPKFQNRLNQNSSDYGALSWCCPNEWMKRLWFRFISNGANRSSAMNSVRHRTRLVTRLNSE